MQFTRLILSAFLLCGAAFSSDAAHTQARLLLAADFARPGDTVLAGLELRMDARWHTYWRNGGAAGIPTQIEWQLPPGVSAGPIRWPIPEKLPDDDLTTYIYKNEAVLLIPLKLSPAVRPGRLEVRAKVSWLECEVNCLPGNAEVQSVLNVGAETKPSKHADLLAAWQRNLPKAEETVSARAWWEKPAQGDLRPLVIEWKSDSAVSGADFYPDSGKEFEVQPATERLPADAGKIRIRKQVRKSAGNWPNEISGLLVQQSGKERLGYEIKVPAEFAPTTSLAVISPGVSVPLASSPSQFLWKMLLYAFLGGLILNLMPCVLPVLALKILGFVGQAKADPRRVRCLGLVYASGVLVSFLGLAALVIGVKAAGLRAGWGIQFGNPHFLVVMTVVVTLVALNLFGLFEINLSGRVIGAAGHLASQHGTGGAFFNGVLATVLATPCTAPFLSIALGFAFTQGPLVIVLMFLMVGLGLAGPYVALSWEPGWLKCFPRPGPWMQRFKVAMGFPMLATAVWLFSLAPLHYGERAWWLALFLVVVALAAWIYGEFVQRSGSRNLVALTATLVLLMAGYGWIIEGQLRWRSPTPSTLEGTLKEGGDGIDWQKWTLSAVAQAQAAGRPVFVDFTAAWCLTCQANKRLAIDVPSVRVKLKEINAVALLGDYTHFPDDITSELNRYGRAGVPLVLVYPKRAAEPAVVLPDVLTPGVVLDALDRAAK